MRDVDQYFEQLDGTLRVRKSSGELGILCLLGLLGVFTVVYSQLNLPLQNPFGAGVGPRLFPQLSGAVMILMSLYLVTVTVWKRRSGTIDDEIIEMPYQNALRLVTVSALSAAYMLAFSEFGFLITTTVLLYLLFLTLGFRRHVLGVVLAVSFTVIIYSGFTKGLGLPLPDPILGEIL